jgi:iron complex transport system permease protein
VRRISHRQLAIAWGSGLLFLLCACLAALTFGEETVSWLALYRGDPLHTQIFFALRVPRVLLGVMVGAALSVSGNTLQMLFRNPLADPFVLGVSGGAALGATIVSFLGLSAFGGWVALSTTAAGALGGALLSTAVVFAMASVQRQSSTVVLLMGVIVNSTTLAGITLLRALAGPEKLGEVLYWLSGVLGYESLSALVLTGTLIVVALATLMAIAPRLNLLSLGDEDAQALGVNVSRTRSLALAACALAIAAAVSLSGLIGFVGLLVPHLTRRLFGADARVSLAASALMGAAMLVLADLGARLLFNVFHTEPPVGVLTALLGGPTFLALLSRRVMR